MGKSHQKIYSQPSSSVLHRYPLYKTERLEAYFGGKTCT